MLHPELYVCCSEGSVEKGRNAQFLEGFGAFVGIAALNVDRVYGNICILCPFAERDEGFRIGIEGSGVVGAQDNGAVILQGVVVTVGGVKFDGENSGILVEAGEKLLARGGRA